MINFTEPDDVDAAYKAARSLGIEPRVTNLADQIAILCAAVADLHARLDALERSRR